jgi:adenylate cyclase class 2
MSHEVELKFFDLDIDALQERVLRLGGVLDYAGMMRAIYFDNGELKKSRGALRLRSQPISTSGEEEVVLTRKIATGEVGVKSCRELETVVGDFEVTREIITSLGYQEVLSVTKHRSSYLLDGGRIEIEEHCEDLAHIPLFVELESSSRDALFALARTLDIDPDAGVALNAFELIRHFRA